MGIWFLQVLVLIALVFSSIPRNSFWGFCCGHISCTLCFQAEDTSKKWHLDRQEDVKEKPMVKELAKILGAKTSNWFLCNVFVHANNVEQWWWWVFLIKDTRWKCRIINQMLFKFSCAFCCNNAVSMYLESVLSKISISCSAAVFCQSCEKSRDQTGFCRSLSQLWPLLLLSTTGI